VLVGASVTSLRRPAARPRRPIQWQKNGANISGATSVPTRSRVLRTADTGTYTVVATNSAGSATSSGAVLTVNVPTVVADDHDPAGEPDGAGGRLGDLYGGGQRDARADVSMAEERRETSPGAPALPTRSPAWQRACRHVHDGGDQFRRLGHEQRSGA